MKNFINNFLRKMGYQISRFNTAPYVFRDTLKSFLDKNVKEGNILDIGSTQGNYPKEHFKNVTTLDLEPAADVIGSIMELPLNNESFDCIIYLEALEHVVGSFKKMSSVYRVFKHREGLSVQRRSPTSFTVRNMVIIGDLRVSTGEKLLMKKFKNMSITPYAGKIIAPGWCLVSGTK